LIIDCSNEIESIGSHFRETGISRLKRLKQSIVERILSSRKPVVKREDCLYETVWRVIENVVEKTEPSEYTPFK
jgi:hypothetical protein